MASGITALLSAQKHIAARADGSHNVELVALLPIAGRTLLERQAEAALRAGCNAIMILVETVPVELTAAIDRLGSNGHVIKVVRTGRDLLADMTERGGRMLLVADGLQAPASVWAMATGTGTPTLLSVEDAPATSSLERIDASWRWAGLALLPAGAAEDLSALPEDWDPQLALLRGAIQDGATPLACDAALFERGDLSVIDSLDMAHAVEARLLASTETGDAGLALSWLFLPLARLSARLLLKSQSSGMIAAGLTAFAAAAGNIALILRYPGLAFGLLLLAAMTTAVATVVAAFRPSPRMQSLVLMFGCGLSWTALVISGWAAAASLTGVGDLTLMHVPWISMALALLLVVQIGVLLGRAGLALPRRIVDLPSIWLLLLAGWAFGNWPIALALALPLTSAALLILIVPWRRVPSATE